MATMTMTVGNATVDPSSYWSVYSHVAASNPQLSVPEQYWAAWYAYMQNPVLATGIMSFVMHEVFYFGRCVPWIIVDYLPFFNRYKIQNTKVPSAWDMWKCSLLVLASHFTIELPQIWLFHPTAVYLGMSVDVPFPAWSTIAYQVAIFFFLEDTWHYWTHRAMHYGPFYKHIHKLHHTYSAPFGLAAEYAHPVEVLVLGIGTVGAPILWVALTGDLHIFTVYIWIILRLVQAVDSHSGYDFPWSLSKWFPLWGGAEHHDKHHEKFVGNYSSSFVWWDKLLDTEATTESRSRQRARAAAAKAKKLA